MRHLLSMEDLDTDEILTLLTTAESMHDVQRREVKKLPTLRGRTIVNLFFEDSTRTRSSFEIAGKWLSADVINISGKGSSTSKGESLRDTAMTVAAMGVDGLVIRHHASGAARQVSQWVDASIVNAGDGTHEHPTQALLDAYTMRRALGDLAGRHVAIVGDLTHSPGAAQQPDLPGTPRCPGHRGRAADADAERDQHVGRGRGVRDVVRPGRRAALGRRRDDAAGAAGADERWLLPDARGSTPSATA